MRYFIVITSIFLLVSCSDVSNQQHEKIENEAVDSIKGLNPGVSARIPYLLSYAVDSTQFPRSIETDGSVRGVPSKDWCSGFFPGSLMYLYQISSDQKFLDRAELWNPYIAKEQWNDKTHDMGFKVYCSIGQAYELTGKPAYKDVLIQAAKTLSTRFDPTVGCIKSWDFGTDRWDYPVIIDNMMNLELLFEVTQLTGDSSFYKIADSHAANTMINHYRTDFSSYHVIDYNLVTGQVQNQLTHQGFDVNSVWSRGQAWGLYGFTMAYRYTKDEAYLNQAINIWEFINSQNNMPEDNIPYWDMKDPSIPNAPRDASAAAVCASAALELYGFTNDEKYKAYALDLIETLSSDAYVLKPANTSPFLLGRSTGNWPKNDEIDAPLSYADYYFLEATFRAKELVRN
ncbi:MAG: glycoside hydrolase family 88 protein [Reichenbachiella sp.]|uniref:glycoside hydrolase family 88 protein n=1 Tax=Reichenbachiella sp. TaxID=2184521 RepID=UPI002965E13E|nr:glycoside hydrolase family 88 protein [Reichenbachiella sp.]MDW3212021.1 glycoside hydrolase family 88 protein [Reichenbachiella sp.]